MNHIEKASITKQGNIVGHEVNESYIGAQHNGGNNKVLSPNGEAAYNQGHNGANKLDPIPDSEPIIIGGVKYMMFPSKTIRLN